MTADINQSNREKFEAWANVHFEYIELMQLDGEYADSDTRAMFASYLHGCASKQDEIDGLKLQINDAYQYISDKEKIDDLARSIYPIPVGVYLGKDEEFGHHVVELESGLHLGATLFVRKENVITK